MTSIKAKPTATPRKTSARRTTPTKPVATSAEPKPAGPVPTPKLVTVSTPVVTEADLKKKELIDLVVEKSGIKKKDAKPVVEAMLAVLGDTIAAGRELNLQPLGKLRINRTEEKSNGRVIVCKLRQSVPGAGGKQTLADSAD